MRFLVLVLITAFALGAVQSSFAQNHKRIALVVANASYKDAQLDNPSLDARLIQPALKAAGFEVTVVLDADLIRFDGAVETFATRAKEADVALFYFAGHGFAVNDGLIPRNYLMSTDALVRSPSERILKSGGIPLDEIVQRLSGAARATLVFVDACRNDPRGKRGSGAVRGLARIETGGIPNLFVAVSTRLGEQAEDGAAGAGSPFARAFAQEIPKPGVRIDDVFAAVRRTVNAETAQRQKPEIVQDDLDAPLVLVTLGEAATLTPAKLEPAAFPAPGLPGALSLGGDPKRSGLTYSFMTAAPYAGGNSLSFIGAWVSLYDPKADGRPGKMTLSFEITGNFPRNKPEQVNYTIGISDTRTVKYFNPAFSMKSDMGHRFFIDADTIKTKRWKRLFQSMEASDQRILAGVCKTIGQPEADNHVLNVVVSASAGHFDKTVESFWKQPLHRQRIVALGKSCYEAISGGLKSKDEAFAKAN
jgi:hypothetical protein